MKFKAKLYRGGVLQGNVFITTVNLVSDLTSSVYTADFPSLAEVNAAVYSATGGRVYSIGVATTMLTAEVFLSDEPGILAQFNHRYFPQEGDTLIFENNSSIWFSNVSISGSGNDRSWRVTLQYKDPNGNIAYNFTTNTRDSIYTSGEVRSVNSIFSIPWIATNHDSNYKLYGFKMEARRRYQMQVTTQTLHAESMIISPANTTYAQNFFNAMPEIDPDDPLPDVPDSDDDQPDDIDGLPDDDPIDIPDIPGLEVTETGFITLFTPTLTQLRNLASYMWSSFFDLNTFKKLFADPMDCILGLNILPFSISATDLGAVSVGNISTGVQMYKAPSQWITVNCGSLNLGKITDTYLDFAPYCKYSIYLPFIGIVTLNTDDVAHKTLSLEYHIDILSCACVAYLKADDSVLYQFSGSCGYEIPVSSNNFASMIANVVAIGATVVTAGATMGGSAVAEGAAEGVATAGSASIHNVTGSKPDVKRAGSLGSAASMLGMKMPYIILEAPNVCKPERQQHYTGYPSYVTRTVGSLSGFAQFDSVIVNGLPCTDTERQMVEDILKGGVYV